MCFIFCLCLFSTESFLDKWKNVDYQSPRNFEQICRLWPVNSLLRGLGSNIFGNILDLYFRRTTCCRRSGLLTRHRRCLMLERTALNYQGTIKCEPQILHLVWSSLKLLVQQESPPAWTQEAYRPPRSRSKCLLFRGGAPPPPPPPPDMGWG